MMVRHFLITNQGSIEEISEEDSQRGLPRFADEQLQYLQVTVDSADDGGQVEVRTLGALVDFDAEGRLQEADARGFDEETLASFEHDACIQFALNEAIPGWYAVN